MKYKAYEGEYKEEVVWFRLFNGECGGVRLVACDKDGEPYAGGNILRITENGSIQLNAEVNESLGLNIDEDNEGCIYVYRYPE